MSKKSVPILFSLFGSESLADAIHQGQGYELGQIILHQFPDEETVIKIDSVVQDKDVIFIANLAHPNNKLLSLLFAAETARELGAKKVGLIAPYLPYMRQDKRFHPEEGITSKYFARLLSTYFDGLVTVDPHLHRWHGLNDIYTIPTHVLHATDSIAEWIKTNVPDAVLIGPDAESLQWVAGLAKVVGAPFLVLEKIRTGDNEVDVSNPEVDAYRHHTPVLVDDIISTAMTMIETVKHLQLLKMKPPVCIGVHGLFSQDAYQALLKAGAKEVVTTNSLQHFSNRIDIRSMIMESMGILFKI